ncbi:MAG: S1 family peptidase [Verrucomicrobiaceae bacterium]
MIRHLLILLCSARLLAAQALDVPIFEQSSEAMKDEEKRIGKLAETFLAEEQALTLKQIQEAMKSPAKRALTLKKPATTPLQASQVAQHALVSTYRVGWAYLCDNCDHWHLNLGGGYAISHDGVLATCAHVVDPGELKIREGTLIAINHKGDVFPVKYIHAYHQEMDAALLGIDATTTPLALNDQVRPGDPAFCLSRPLDQGKYFSAGIVNRFFWDKKDRGGNDTGLNALSHLRLNVSTPWAPGSSGSPVLDSSGNAIGHVARIAPLTKKKNSPALITLHIAIPARSIKALASH